MCEAAMQVDVQGICVSFYQGADGDDFKYIVDLLKENDAEQIKVFGGGGGTIIPREIKELHDYGIDWIFTPEDGRKMGLQGMINKMMELSDYPLPIDIEEALKDLRNGRQLAMSRLITYVERGDILKEEKETLLDQVKQHVNKQTPVLGITGTGGAGKSSLTDELILRFLQECPD